MAKRSTSTYKPVRPRSRDRALGGWRGRLRLRRARPRREAVLVGGLALAVIVALATLGGAVLLAKVDHDWASIATVNGQSISREALRSRVSVLELLATERYSFIASEVGPGVISASEASDLQAGHPHHWPMP